MNKSTWISAAIACILMFPVGFFVGRWSIGKSKTTLEARSAQQVQRQTTSEQTAPPLQLAMGETHQSDGFSITLAEAEVTIPQVNFYGERLGPAGEQGLVLRFDVANTADRKLLRFNRQSKHRARQLRLHDDAGNEIRSVDYGYTSYPFGALTGDEDIDPGQSTTHVEVFSIPPPKTEYLILSIDLKCLGGEGIIEYMLPATEIAMRPRSST